MEKVTMSSKKTYINTGAYLRQLYDALVSNLHKRLADEGYPEITPSHGLVFQYLKEAGSRITELAVLAGMTKQSMSALVYQLEDLGYLKRRNDPEDARAVLFVLTPKGSALKQKAQQFNYEFEKNWERTLGTVQYDKFRDYLTLLTGADR
ncbi:MAG: MarR family transcriptional regulator [Chryseolinea sp.]